VAHISGTLSAVTYFLRLGLVTTGNSGTSTSDTEFCRFGLLGFSDFSTSVFFLFRRFLEYIILLKTTGTSRGTVDERLGFPFFLTLVPTLLSP
jgi:hypothetical protein